MQKDFTHSFARGGSCYESEDSVVDGCVCHETCGDCGFYNWPSADDDCFTCPEGSEIEAVYSDGTGYCKPAGSSYDEGEDDWENYDFEEGDWEEYDFGEGDEDWDYSEYDYDYDSFDQGEYEYDYYGEDGDEYDWDSEDWDSDNF